VKPSARLVLAVVDEMRVGQAVRGTVRLADHERACSTAHERA
jgi:hypothetical protein